MKGEALVCKGGKSVSVRNRRVVHTPKKYRSFVGEAQAFDKISE